VAIGTSDGERLAMDRSEAGAIADSIVAELRSVRYEDLAGRLLREIETREVAGNVGGWRARSVARDRWRGRRLSARRVLAGGSQLSGDGTDEGTQGG
jgi:hypothetical protein